MTQWLRSEPTAEPSLFHVFVRRPSSPILIVLFLCATIPCTNYSVLWARDCELRVGYLKEGLEEDRLASCECTRLGAGILPEEITCADYDDQIVDVAECAFAPADF